MRSNWVDRQIAQWWQVSSAPQLEAIDPRSIVTLPVANERPVLPEFERSPISVDRVWVKVVGRTAV
jgi:hypothetical protein